MPAILNMVAYQAGWFACVLGAANELPWLGAGVSTVVVALHLLLTTQRRIEIKLIGAAMVVGLLLDSALASAGLVEFHSGVLIDGVTPPWMLALWIGFATTLNVSMRWLVSRPWLAMAFGAAGGPIAYYAGVRLGAMQIPTLDIGLVAIGASWAAAMWILATLTIRFNKANAVQEQSA